MSSSAANSHLGNSFRQVPGVSWDDSSLCQSVEVSGLPGVGDCSCIVDSYSRFWDYCYSFATYESHVKYRISRLGREDF